MLKKHYLFLFIGLIIGLLALFYNQPNSPSNPNPVSKTTQTSSLPSTIETSNYQSIKAKEFYDWLSSGKDIFLIDVREPSEFKEGYLKGAVNIPLGQIEGGLQEIPKDKDVVVYCRTGKRSAEASKILVKNGYKKVFNLEGGIVNWPYEVIKR